MNDTTVWSDLHSSYKKQDWIHRPSLFAETATTYFPSAGRVLDLGAGLAQDSNFFAERGYDVTSTDIEAATLEKNEQELPKELRHKITFQKVDLREALPYDDESFDVVYAHLSLHYFTHELTTRLIGEIQRVLKPGGVIAFLVNSVNDPEYGTGAAIEPDYFQVGDASKRYFSVDSARTYMRYFDTVLLDDHGETYKDAAKGVHNLIRYIGTKRPAQHHPMAIPYAGAIIERTVNDEVEVLVQTRWKPHADPVYSGTFEFPAGVLDKPFEDVYTTVAREIKEECGLTLKSFKDQDRNEVMTPLGKTIGFRPFCCTQQIENGKPWIGFVFICEVEPGDEPVAQLSEARDAKWMKASEVQSLFEATPKSFFGLELPAWKYYFDR